MKRLFLILTFITLLCSNAVAARVYWYNATSLTGGGTSALDSINGQNLVGGDKCLVVTASGQSYIYNLDTDSALTESSPSVISPDSNAGDKRWILMWSGGRVIIPDSTIDQGSDSVTGTLAWHITNAAGAETTVTILPGTYDVTTDITVPITMNLAFEKGGLLAPSAETVEVTVYSPEHIIAGERQKIIDTTSNAVDPLLFTTTGTVYPDWWGTNTTPGTTNMATPIQLAVNSIGAVGTMPQLGTGGRVDLNGRYSVESTIDINYNGVRIFGNGRQNTLIINNTTNDHTFEFAPTAPLTDTLDGGGIIGMTMDYNSADPTAGSHVYIHRTSSVDLIDLHLRDHFRGVNIEGAGANTRIDLVDIEQGTNTTAVQSGSRGINIVRSQVDSGDANAVQDSADSLYYTEPNSIFISNCNIRAISTAYGYEYGLYVRAVDGLYLSNNHIDGGDVGAVIIHAQQANLSINNIHSDGLFIDPSDTLTSDYGLRYLANGALASSIVRYHTWVGTIIDDGASVHNILMTGDWQDVAFVGGVIRKADQKGMFAQTGENLVVSGISFFDNNADSGTDAHLAITNVDGATVNGCVFDTAYRGVLIDGTSENISITGNAFKNLTEGTVHDAIYLAQTSGTDKISCSGNSSETSATIASAGELKLPVEHDMFSITGTTTITNIDSDNETGGYSAFDGKTIELVFTGILQVTDGGNMKLAGNFTTSADDVLTLVFFNEVWYEISRSAN